MAGKTDYWGENWRNFNRLLSSCRPHILRSFESSCPRMSRKMAVLQDYPILFFQTVRPEVGTNASRKQPE
jgi:hypothetical protein